MKKTLLLVALLVFLLPSVSFAQFGKNQVIWEKTTWNLYRSAHFDFYISLDIKEKDIQEHLTGLVSHLEGSYDFLAVKLNHGLKKRPIVVVSRTHSAFEALHLAGDEFMPEGVGAYAFPRGSQLLPGTELILVIKPDFLPVLNRTIYTHELVHIFQFDMIGWNFIGRSGGSSIEGWLYEATADYMANKYAPYSRDDIRRMQQRVAAANVKNPQMGLPTLEMLSEGQANPYSLGAMPFMFLEEKFSESLVVNMVAHIFKQRGQKFVELLADISRGEFYNAETFDRAHRDYWSSKYSKDSLERPRPYQETSSVNSRQVIRFPFPYPLTSPEISPGSNQVAFLTFNPKNGIVLAVAPMLPRENPPYVPSDKRKKFWLFGSKVPVKAAPIRILTTFMPPKHYEYIISQELNVWPFNGSDLDWWQDAEWIKKVKDAELGLKSSKEALSVLRTVEQDKRAEDYAVKMLLAEEKIVLLEKELADLMRVPNVSKIVFFARLNKDHALFILDANTKKFISKMELPLDQSFSPNFSPDGEVIYFSAAKNIQRDIYSLNLKTREIKNLTNGGVFNSAPRVSPDGTQLVYVAFVGGFQKIFHLDIESGRKSQLTFGRWNDNSPDWSSEGDKLVYTSDEKDGIWNLYTFERGEESYLSRQWTDYYGGVFAPKFVPGENDRIVYSGYLEEDQFRSYIFPNFELFDALLKEPLRTSMAGQPAGGENENMELAFRSQNAVTEQLDRRQLDNLKEPPARWKFYGTDVSIGTDTYWGTFAFTRLVVQDILANRTHLGLYAQRGDFRYLDYTYLDRSRRWGLAANVSQSQFPIRTVLYNFEGENPRYPDPDGDYDQFIINNTWIKETSASFYTEYPFSKWSRVEMGVRPRKRSYFLPLSDADMEFFGSEIPEIDRQFYNFFKDSNGRTNLGFSAAFVHDTVMYSDFGPLHGNAMRAQIEYGPGLSKGSESYVTTQVDVRKYMRLSEGSLFAVNFVGMNSTRPNGDVAMMGGTEKLRSYPYFSIAGNQIGFGSAELRFPVADVALLSAIPFRVRGILFGDYAVVSFSNDGLSAKREWAYGFGLQANIFMPMNFEWARTKFAPDKWNFNFRIGFGF